MRRSLFKKILAFVLNSPYTLFGILLAILSVPRSLNFDRNQFALIFRVRLAYPFLPYMKSWRGMALGNVVILNKRELPNDLEHELIHVEQFNRHPFIHYWMNIIELYKKGYRNNRFEIEAYDRSKSVYLGKEKLHDESSV